MTRSASNEAVPIAAFADPAATAWGIVVGGTAPLVVVGSLAPDSSAGSGAPLEVQTAASDWSLSWAGSDLTLSPTPPDAASEGIDGTLELCRVSGTVTLDGAACEIDCAGVRSGQFPSARFDSSRLVAAWFPGDAGMALLAIRPSGAKGHERDSVLAAVRGETEPATVFDPRLSTTYEGDGTPRRLGVELWLGESEEADLHSRRFAGESLNSIATLRSAGVRIDGYALRCQGGDAAGPGVYLIARPD
jgi:hypothetical protein